MLPEEPKEFPILCQQVGLALMMGQKVQFALSYYYSVYHIVNSGWSKEEAKKKIDFHLSHAMGVVVAAIEKDAQPESDVLKEIKKFKESRNWLAHDFDEESTPYLTKGEKFQEYIEKMEKIFQEGYMLMQRLNAIGEKLAPIGI